MADYTTSRPQSSSSLIPGGSGNDIGADIISGVQDVLQGGRIRKIRIKLGNRTIKEIPTDAAAVLAVVIAVAAVVVSQLRIEVEKH